MKVKIVNCYDPMLWYAKHIGEIFDIEVEEDSMYWARERNMWRCLNWIRKKDCEVIDERSVSDK